jgi:hypothetical protein
MPTEIVTRTEKCGYCLRETVVVTVEQLLSTRGDVVALTVLVKEFCTSEGCVGSRIRPR